jgi:hypothetical protein
MARTESSAVIVFLYLLSLISCGLIHRVVLFQTGLAFTLVLFIFFWESARDSLRVGFPALEVPVESGGLKTMQGLC